MEIGGEGGIHQLVGTYQTAAVSNNQHQTCLSERLYGCYTYYDATSRCLQTIFNQSTKTNTTKQHNKIFTGVEDYEIAPQRPLISETQNQRFSKLERGSMIFRKFTGHTRGIRCIRPMTTFFSTDTELICLQSMARC